MTDRYREQWEAQGAADPYGSALANPSKQSDQRPKEAFYALAEEAISHLFDRLQERNIEVTFCHALDFGCGAGCLSRALASRFARVTSVDTSTSMLDEAKLENAPFDNIEFRHTPTDDLRLLDDQSVDFVCSDTVLQHMPDTAQIRYIREFGRVLKPGGTLVLQTPSHGNLATWQGWAHRLLGNAVTNIARRARAGNKPRLEIHALPKTLVHKLLRSEGLRIEFTERPYSAGKPLERYRYYAVKPPEDA